MGRPPRPSLSQGYSLVELLMTIAIIGIVSGFAILAFTNVLPNIRADSAMQLAEAQFRQARQTSVDQRRNVRVTFQGTGEMKTELLTQDFTTTPPTVVSATPLSDFVLPYGMVFMRVSGVPDTPDTFGNAADVSFNCGAGLPCWIIFQSDGTVLDNSQVTYVNGTLFMGKTGQSQTARAVTILGATGRIRGYRYNGSAWF
jgi:prepilin-type N-terminal cleavage/methylation domain-containing protein